jgi:hypothetical protein
MIRRFALSIFGFYHFFCSNAQTTITLQPDATEGKDAPIFYVTSQSTSKGPTNTTNYGNDPDLPSMEWTFDGSPGRKQGLIEFNLSSIPAGATIISANLSLYHSENSQDIGHSTLSGSNATLIQRITSEWLESTVTWNTKPSITTQNQVILPSSTSETEDYENIDVSALIQDMIDDPANSHGLMISMQTQAYYRKMIFASSDHTNSALHPKLEICYSIVSSIDKPITSQNLQINIQPNPFSDHTQLKIETTNNIFSDFDVKIFDITGSEVMSMNNVSDKFITINRNNLKQGIYFYQILSHGEVVTRGKMIIRD